MASANPESMQSSDDRPARDPAGRLMLARVGELRIGFELVPLRFHSVSATLAHAVPMHDESTG